MPIYKKIYEPNLETDRAKNVEGETVYIGDADSGRKGYFCLGCDKQMQANIQQKNPNYRSYFSHVPVDISKGEIKCTYSNREHREIIASDILQRIKRIKVPAVLKFPPKGDKRNPVELDKAKFISAFKVRSQVTFYEDEEAKIHNGKNPDVNEKYLILRPDVVFYNEKDEPILFIELVVTHKVSEEKKIKLRRLGIDTISIIIPRGSDQEIEENFNSVQRVKWEYNDQEACTTYLSVSDRAPEGVLEFDKQQGRIFGESFTCRLSRVNNTIRSLRKCLEGELYRELEQDFEREIFRVKNATEGARERLGNLEREYEEEIFSGFNSEYQELQQRQEELRRKEEEFQKYHANLEERYFRKAEEIGLDQEQVNEDQRAELENGGTEEEIKAQFGKNSKELRDEFERISEEWKLTIRERKESNREISDRREKLAGVFEGLEKEEQGSFISRKSTIEENIEKEYRSEKERIYNKIRGEDKIIRGLREKIKAIPDHFGELEEREHEDFGEKEARIIEEEKQLEENLREELIRESNDPSNGIPRRVKHLLEAQRVGSDYKAAQRQEADYQRSREFLKKGTWKRE